MAYPDYSIVIVSVTENGVTNDYAQSFFNDELAKKAYYQAISEGKRAFYYEKPIASRFSRNDSQPLKVNTENGLENQPLAAGGVEQKVGEIAEEVFRGFTQPIETAITGVNQIVEFSAKVGDKIWDIYAGYLGLQRKVINEILHIETDTVAYDTVISNKRVVVKHDGSGFFKTAEITKLWPNKDEITWTPPLDQPATQVLIQILNEPAVAIGTKRNKKVHDGTENGGVVTEEYVWVTAGFTILETETHTYRSNGNGWYTATEREHSACEEEGTVLTSTFAEDLTYPIVLSDGLSHYVIIGQRYLKEIANGDCTSNSTLVDEWLPEGTIVYETDTTYYKSNGLGGVIEEAKSNGGGGDGGDGGDGGTNCTEQGTIVSTDYEALPAVDEHYDGLPFNYSQGYSVVDNVADGSCSTSATEPRIEYNEEGVYLGGHLGSSQQGYDVTAGVNGTAVFHPSNQDDEMSDENLDGTLRSQPETTLDDGVGDGPQGSDCVNPPPANYGDLTTTSVLKSSNGQIIGTIKKRDNVLVTLPSGYYITNVMGVGGAYPSNSYLVTTGHIWSGRFIADGDCGWVPEDESDTNDKRWWFPSGTAFPEGYFQNRATVTSSGQMFDAYYDLGDMPDDNTGKRIWHWRRYKLKHDGKGNVTIEWQTAKHPSASS